MTQPTPGNILQLPPCLPPEEWFETLQQQGNVRVERIISTGQTTPAGSWYNQPGDEWVLLIQGQAQLAYETGAVVDLVAGDYLWIPAHCKHRVTATSHHPPCIWLAIHWKPEDAAG